MKGFSLVEVLIAMAITVGVGAIVFQLFHQNERLFLDETVREEMQQTARMVISQVGDDIRIAGQGIPPALGDVILPGSNGQRLNLRAGFSATESLITTPPPITVVVGSPITLKVQSTSGFSAGKQVLLWNTDCWLRATVSSVSGSALSLSLLPTAGSAPTVQFGTAPVIGLDEAVALYFDNTTHSVRRTTSSNTTNLANPPWAPANDVGTNVTRLDFLYFDAQGNALTASTPQSRAAISSIEARVGVRAASQPETSLYLRVYPRNLQYR